MNWDGLGAYGTIPFDPLRLFAGDVFSEGGHFIYLSIYRHKCIFTSTLFSSDSQYVGHQPCLLLPPSVIRDLNLLRDKMYRIAVQSWECDKAR